MFLKDGANKVQVEILNTLLNKMCAKHDKITLRSLNLRPNPKLAITL